jgi:3-oxoacyl-(acyl-carrier-protein) synthase
MNRQRVVITGMGTVNPLGNNINDFWINSLKGKSGVINISHLFFIPEHMSQIAGVTKIPFLNDKKQNRNQIFADMAANEALNNSLLLDSTFDPEECGVLISTAIAEINMMESTFDSYKQGKGYIDFIPKNQPFHAHQFFFNHIASKIAEDYGLKGSTVTIATGCTGGNDAIGYAMHMIRSGRLKVALTGSVEAPITPLVVAAFDKIGATSKRNKNPDKASRPFDLDRDGFVLSEGAAILVLENFEHAKQRGAPILAEIVGMGSVNNFYHMTDIPQDGQSLAKACEFALKDARISADDINFINTHGSSTPQNDIAESNAFYSVFKERAKQIPVTSIKSQLGHALSAANSIEIISSVLSIQHQIVSPTLNLENQDPKCPINVIHGDPFETGIDTVLKTSSGFSGIHTCLILKKAI